MPWGQLPSNQHDQSLPRLELFELILPNTDRQPITSLI